MKECHLREVDANGPEYAFRFPSKLSLVFATRVRGGGAGNAGDAETEKVQAKARAKTTSTGGVKSKYAELIRSTCEAFLARARHLKMPKLASDIRWTMEDDGRDCTGQHTYRRRGQRQRK